MKKLWKREEGYADPISLVVMLIIIAIVIGLGFAIFCKDEESITTTQTGVELQVVDKFIDKQMISTGKVTTVTRSYKLKVAIDEEGLDVWTVTVSSSEYDAIEIGSYAMFTLSLDENNNLVKLMLE